MFRLNSAKVLELQRKEVKAIRRACLDTHARAPGVKAIHDENLAAARAHQSGDGATTIMANGQSASDYLAGKGENMGMSGPDFAAYVLDENLAAATKCSEVEDEYLRLAYAVLPTAGAEAGMAAVAGFRDFCKARSAT